MRGGRCACSGASWPGTVGIGPAAGPDTSVAATVVCAAVARPVAGKSLVGVQVQLIAVGPRAQIAVRHTGEFQAARRDCRSVVWDMTDSLGVR